MFTRILASRFLFSLPARALSRSCQNQCTEKPKPKSVEDWKWKSNYFKNHWNREAFGPKLQKKSIEDIRAKVQTPKQSSQNSEAFWLGKIYPNSSNLPKGEKYSELKESILTAAATLQHPETPSLISEPVHSSYDNENYMTYRTPVTVPLQTATTTGDNHLDLDKFPLNNPNRSDHTDAASETIHHTRDLQAKDNIVSVTKVLKETMPIDRKLALQRWEETMIKEMGLENFQKLQEMTLLRGERLHSAIEMYFDTGSLEVSPTWDDVSKHHLESLEPVIEKFHRPALALESQVTHPVLVTARPPASILLSEPLNITQQSPAVQEAVDLLPSLTAPPPPAPAPMIVVKQQLPSELPVQLQVHLPIPASVPATTVNERNGPQELTESNMAARSFILTTTTRQNLDSIVEAIRHLEGDHLFSEDQQQQQQQLQHRHVVKEEIGEYSSSTPDSGKQHMSVNSFPSSAVLTDKIKTSNFAGNSSSIYIIKN